MAKRKKNNRSRTRATSSNITSASPVRTGRSPSATTSTSKKTSAATKNMRRRKRIAFGGAGAVVVLLAALLVVVLLSPTSNQPAGTDRATTMVSGPPGPEGVPLEVGTLLAPESSAAKGSTVDGTGCDATEQVVYHVHTHLSVYVNGKLRPLPAGIDIVEPVPEATADGPFDSASTCYYWLHVHTQDGVIHIESPTERAYSLGDFFDIWRQPLTRTKIAGVEGKLTVFVNGRRYNGNPRDIELGSHLDIQIDVGTPVIAPKSVDWATTQL